jgi:hypothetical protein
MFHDEAVAAADRMDEVTKKSMLWAQLPLVDREAAARAHGGRRERAGK